MDFLNLKNPQQQANKNKQINKQTKKHPPTNQTTTTTTIKTEKRRRRQQQQQQQFQQTTTKFLDLCNRNAKRLHFRLVRKLRNFLPNPTYIAHHIRDQIPRKSFLETARNSYFKKNLHCMHTPKVKASRQPHDQMGNFTSHSRYYVIQGNES